MNKYFERLNEALDESERIFGFRSATWDGKAVAISLLARESDRNAVLDERLKGKVSEISKKIMPEGCECVVRYVKSSFDEGKLLRKIKNCLESEHIFVYRALAGVKLKVERDADGYAVRLPLPEYLEGYARRVDLAARLSRHLALHFIDPIRIEYERNPNASAEFGEARMPAPVPSKRHVDIEVTENFGRPVLLTPVYICDAFEDGIDADGACVCGKVTDVNKREVASERNGKKREFDLYSFGLNDTTGSVRCKFFSLKPSKRDWDEVLVADKSLVATGDYKEDRYNGCRTLFVRHVAECEIDFAAIDKKSNFNFDYGRYRFVAPEPFSDFDQLGFGETHDARDGAAPVAPLRAVWLEFARARSGAHPFEVAVAAIEGGAIRDAFCSRIRPPEPFLAAALEKSGLDEYALSDAPAFKDIVPDLHRYIGKDAVVIGWAGIEDDMARLNDAARRHRYKFANRVIDIPKRVDATRVRRRATPFDMSAELGLEIKVPDRSAKSAILLMSKLFMRLAQERLIELDGLL